MRRRTIKLHIAEFTPDTLSMARLAEYLADYAALLGSRDFVHFAKVEEGSATLVSFVQPDHVQEVRHRLRLVGTGDAPEDAARAYEEINARLRRDGTTATIEGPRRAKLLQLPGTVAPTGYRSVVQQGAIDGVLAKVGGWDTTVPVHLAGDQGKHLRCNATRELARELATHLFGKPLRLFGVGRWDRSPRGQWELNHFDIDRFELLNDDPISAVIERIRAIPGNEWGALEDPIKELALIRGGSEED